MRGQDAARWFLVVGLLAMLAAAVAPAQSLAFGMIAVAAVSSVGAFVLIERRSRELSASLDETIRRLLQSGGTDEVTGLASRAAFARAIDGEIARVNRGGGRFAVLRVDVVGLSKLDAKASEDVLRWFAGVLSRQTRGIDARARLGGDEFGIVLVGADSHTATRVVDRIQAMEDAPGARLTFGIATYPEDGADAEALLRRAEEELAVLA
ncbi:MAG TPA: GGDEF domain-containing protein [Candidatus Dormibacteraeota bacterium]|nr:GGDEF domain-containing protein [Candidatus Dormibacteraeota bacterium]